MRQIDVMMRKIDIRTHNEFAQQASLHGAKIPLRYETPPTLDVPSDFDDEKANRALVEAQARVRSRYGR